MISGFRLDIQGRIRNRLSMLQDAVRADAFKPEVLQYAKVTLETCINSTPVRDEGLINANQTRQYANRVDYIESIHWNTADPRLIVKDDGQYLFSNGRWFRVDMDYRLPDADWANYMALDAERERRLQTKEQAFIRERAQARFLYQRSWYEVAVSIGISLSNAAAQVIGAHSRHNPPKRPRRAFGQVLGGKNILNIPIRNAFLEEPSQYKQFSGRAILNAALRQHRPRFLQTIENRLKRIMRAARKG